MLVRINTDLICTFQPFLGAFSSIQEESLKLCQTDIGIFHADLMIPLIKLLKIQVLLMGM